MKESRLQLLMEIALRQTLYYIVNRIGWRDLIMMDFRVSDADRPFMGKVPNRYAMLVI